MKIKDIAFVCYPVDDLKIAKEFYEGILRLQPTSTWVQDDKNGFIEYNIKNSCLAIGAGSENFKAGKTGACAAFEIEDFDDAMKELEKAKVKFISKPSETPVCFMCIIEDPFGNQIMLHKKKELKV